MELTPASDWLHPKLSGWATQTAARMGGASVWLVGSALTKDHPRDTDIAIVLPDAQFCARYGLPPDDNASSSMSSVHHPDYSPGWRRWANETAHLTERLQTTYHGLVLNIQIMPQSLSDKWHADRPRLRLDELEAPWPETQASPAPGASLTPP